jgi:hypothetical protein
MLLNTPADGIITISVLSQLVICKGKNGSRILD